MLKFSYKNTLGVTEEIKVEKIFRFDPSTSKEDIAKLELFGWKIVSKEKAKELVAVNTYEDVVKVTAERDEETENGKKLAKLEEEYANMSNALISANAKLNSLGSLSKRPEWSWWTTDRGYGSYFVYYGDYEPVTLFNILLLVPPLIIVGLPILLVKLSKNKKSKAKYQEELKAYEEKASKYNADKEAINAEIADLEAKLNDIIVETNSLRA